MGDDESSALRDHKRNNSMEEEAGGTIRKKQRSQNQNQQQESSLSPQAHLGSNSQWLFQQANHNVSSSSSSSSMVLSDHLGDTSHIVESMTHYNQVGQHCNWSLTSLSQQPQNANNNKKGRANKQERCKAARHTVMRAFRAPRSIGPTNHGEMSE